MIVPTAGKHLNHIVIHLQYRNIKCAAAEIIDQNLLTFFPVQTVGERRSRRFIDNTQNMQSGNLSGISGCLSLCICKIGRDRNHRVSHRSTQIRLRIFFQFCKNHCGKHFGCVNPSVDLQRVVSSHIPLEGRNGSCGIGHRLTLCRISDKAFPTLGKRNHRRGCPRTVRPGDYDGYTTLHNRHAGICGSKINPDKSRHSSSDFLTAVTSTTVRFGGISQSFSFHVGNYYTIPL